MHREKQHNRESDTTRTNTAEAKGSVDMTEETSQKEMKLGLRRIRTFLGSNRIGFEFLRKKNCKFRLNFVNKKIQFY